MGATVFVDGTVYKDATVLNDSILDALAVWLCETNDYHDAIEQVRSMQTSDKAFDAQRKKNGGYCNICRDHAGAIMEKFNVTTWEVQQ